MDEDIADPYETVWSKPCRIARTGLGDHTLKRCLDAVHSAESRFHHAMRKRNIPTSNELFAYDADRREIATLDRHEDYVRLDLAAEPRKLTILLKPIGPRILPFSAVSPDRADREGSFRRAFAAARCSLADATDPELVLSEQELADYETRSLALIGICSERSGREIPMAVAPAPGSPAVCAVRITSTRIGRNLLTRREQAAWGLPETKSVMSRTTGQTFWDVLVGPYCASSELGDPIALAAAIRSLPKT